MTSKKPSRSSDAVDAFLAGYAKRTRATYGNALSNFRGWCASHNVEPLDVKAWRFDLYVVELAQTHARSSVHNNQGVISRFYDYLVARGELSSSPIPAGWRTPIPYRVNPDKSVPGATLEALDKAATELGGVHIAILRLIMEVGLLPEAIGKIDVTDLSLQGSPTLLTIRHRHGTGIPVRRLSPELAKVLRELAAGRADGAVLLNSYGNPFDRRNVVRVLDRIADRAGVPHITPTSLKQSAVAALAQSGLSTAQIEGLFGVHSRRLKDLPVSTASEATPAAFALQLLALSDMLLDEPGAEPAASVVLTGAGLEYYLKRMAGAAGLAPSPTGGIAGAASGLRSAGVISKQERKSIEVWGGLRNSAVHGDFGDVSDLDARHLNEAFGAFVRKHPL